MTPLYLRAQSGQLPELKRVIAVYGDKVVMEETLGEALNALFKPPPAATASTPAPAAAAPNLQPGPVAGSARDALAHYNSALAKLKAGDWSGFGAELNALGSSLEQLNRAPPGRR